MILSKTGYAILGMLTIRPMSGYDIRQTMEQSTAAFWSESAGQLYPALARLTQQKLISGKDDKNNTRRKKIYAITTAGKAELKKWLEQEPETSLIRNEFLLKLFFGANVSKHFILEHVQNVRYQTKTLLTHLIEKKKALSIEESSSSHLPFWEMALQYGICMNQAKLTWCDEVLEFLKH